MVNVPPSVRVLVSLLGLVLATTATLTSQTTAVAAGPGPDRGVLALDVGRGDDAGPARILPRTAAARSTRDVPPMPRRCVRRGDVIQRTAMRCNLTPHIPGAPTVVLWGDSHAWQMTGALRSAIGSRRVNLVSFLFGGCPVMDPRFTSEKERDEAGGCLRTGDLATRYLAAKKARGDDVRVVVAMSWELYHNNSTPLDETDREFPGYRNPEVAKTARLGRTRTPYAFAFLGRLQIPTDVVAPMPMVPGNLRDCARGERPYRCSMPRRGALVDEEVNLARIARLRTRLTAPSRLVRPAGFLCSPGHCVGVKRGADVYYDDLHISNTVSTMLGRKYFARTVSALLDQSRRG